MFYLRYVVAELRRRKGRTILTALGLAVGVGLVVTVTALSRGLDDAQAEVLEPLTGVGTDMSVNRPITVEAEEGEESFSAGPPGESLSPQEQKQLEGENGGPRVGFGGIGEPGEKFTEHNFVTTDLSFPERQVATTQNLAGVAEASGALTLDSMVVSGTVPESTGEGEGEVQALGARPTGPESIDIEQSSVTGVDAASADLAPVTPEQLADGRYLRDGKPDEALVSVAHAEEQGIEIGDQVKLGDHEFEVVGIASPPLGGESSDLYVPLEKLQKISDREGRVNVLNVRAQSSDQVASVASEIESSFKGSEVTTAGELADRVSGSLVDAQSLSDKLGIALAVIALGAAFLIASLLTLSAVNKRTRELGTLKALGWRQRLVIRQVTGESVVQGILGGLAGAVIGIGGAALIGALGINLEATVAGEESGLTRFGPGGGFGQGEVAAGSNTVALDAPVDVGLLLLAIGLAVLGGLFAGAVGGARAARLRPAEALRSVE
jgi:putative ABC transport system permease protein